MRRLRVRLALTHLLVALVGAVVTAVVVRISAPALFDEGLMGLGPGFGGRGGTRLREVFSDAVTQGLLLGAGAALLVALVAAWVVGDRLARPLDDVRAATRRIAQGDYEHTVAEPYDEELAALARDVNALGQALGEVEGRRVRLLGEVAHEMRTPLTVLTGRVEGLVDGVFEADEQLLAELQAELSRLRRLADDLSALSRVEEGRLDLEMAELSLADLVEGAVRRWKALLGDAHVSISSTHDGGGAWVVGDGQRLAQVLDNLVGNAVRAVTAAGGDAGEITVDTRVEGDRVVVRVSDDGVGIPAEDLDRVFERFYRVLPPGGGGATGGSGIGLTVSRGVVEAHGGSLVAESDGAGAGATLVMSLPAVTGRG